MRGQKVHSAEDLLDLRQSESGDNGSGFVPDEEKVSGKSQRKNFQRPCPGSRLVETLVWCHSLHGQRYLRRIDPEAAYPSSVTGSDRFARH